MFVAQPADPFLETEQRRTVVDRLEPLGQLSTGHVRDPRDQTLMGLFGVLVRHAPSLLSATGGPGPQVGVSGCLTVAGRTRPGLRVRDCSVDCARFPQYVEGRRKLPQGAFKIVRPGDAVRGGVDVTPQGAVEGRRA